MASEIVDKFTTKLDDIDKRYSEACRLVIVASEVYSKRVARVANKNDFTPCLWVLTQRQIADQLCIAAIFGEESFRAIWLPKTITTLPPELELRFIGLICRTHFKRNGGEVPHFGGIRGYQFVRRPNQRWTFDVTGNLIDRHGKEVPTGKYTLSLKRKPSADVAPLFRRHLR